MTLTTKQHHHNVTDS